MNKHIIKIALAIIVIAAFVIPMPLLADDGAKTSGLKIGDKVKFGRDIEGTYLGLDAKGRQTFKSTISAPIYSDARLQTKVDCSWQSVGMNDYVSKANLFYADVQKDKVKLNNGELEWTPTIEIVNGNNRETARYTYSEIISDYINSNYTGNVIRMTYTYSGGQLYRDLRLIEGVLCEYFYLDKAPSGDLHVTTNAKGNTARLSAPSAWDKNYKTIKISGTKDKKILLLSDLANATYPVILEPSATYYTSASDGHIEYGYETTSCQAGHDARHDGTSGTNLWTSSTLMYVKYYSWHFAAFPTQYGGDIERLFVYFDTSALPDDTTITDATLSLYGTGSYDNDFGAWTVQVQSGMPTYPGDPLTLTDYNYTYYSGNGGTIAASNFSTSGYKAITLNADGKSWISKTGTTKFCLRELDHDINDVATCPADSGWYNYIQVYSYEQGVGYRPKLDVTYSVATPTVSTSAATGVACTIATFNGEITNTGGEANDHRGFVWDTSAKAAPGNVLPAASGYANNWDEAGSFGTGVFDYDKTGLTELQTYYFRAYSHNSAGYTYGDELSFTCWGDPEINLVAASNIATTTARLNSYLVNDNGDAVEVRFGWGTTDQGNNIAAYDHFSVYEGAYTDGQTPYLDIASLTATTLYYYNVQAQNDCGTDTGTVSSFTTETTIGSPSNGLAIPAATSVIISWTKGTGASNTIVRFKANDCPTGTADGVLIYSSTASTYTHTGLTPGTDYCYYIRGTDGLGNYSTSALTIHATTLAGSASTDVITSSPTQPSNYMTDPTPSATLTTKNPLAPYIGEAATSSGTPLNWLWFFLTMIGISIGAFMMYKITHHTVSVLFTIIVLTVAGWGMTLVPWYIMGIMVILAIGGILLQRSNTQ